MARNESSIVFHVPSRSSGQAAKTAPNWNE